ncbi:MAG: hypothetical protein PHH54_04180 [Candidatus Nanoarchaeia archaeon]|nr:hypothetical protein [Candidatus Nanoarchaeia archaeon]MDD5741158.1 hypothetical protein [Candidatus Nanoarchaeia archaeon]
MKNKNAVIGATMTWVVATMIILVVVIVFIYSSYALAKEKKIIGFSPLTLEGEQSSSIDSEQILLALMETELDEKKVKDYVSAGNYEVLKEKITPLLDGMSNKDNWNMYIYDSNKIIKIKGNELARTSKSSIVFIGNKKVKLFSDLTG